MKVKNKSSKKPRYTLSKTRREKILKERGYMCEQCGFDERPALSIHHKDGDTHNNDPSNLEVLCYNCHHIRHSLSRKHPNLYKEQEATESVTDVNFKVSGERTTFSIRVDRNIKEAFQRLVREEGLSSCDYFEKIMLGTIVGFTSLKNQSLHGNTLNVQVDIPRIVKRVRRRRSMYFEDEVKEEWVKLAPDFITQNDVQQEIHCHFCKRAAVGLAESVQGSRVFVCDVHQRELQKHKKWKVL